jgi:hypothetical protein
LVLKALGFNNFIVVVVEEEHRAAAFEKQKQQLWNINEKRRTNSSPIRL